MLELLGSGYVIDHVIAEYNKSKKEECYRIYVTDMLKAVAEFYGITVNYRYSEMIEPPKEETKSGDEVALEVIQKLGLKGKANGLYETESDFVA